MSEADRTSIPHNCLLQARTRALEVLPQGGSGLPERLQLLHWTAAMRACQGPARAVRGGYGQPAPRRAPLTRRGGALVQASKYPSFIPDEAKEVTEPAACAFLSRAERMALDVEGVGQVGTAFVGPAAGREYDPAAPGVVFLHGFDSAFIEFRRLQPIVEQELPSWSVDLAGWGYTDAGFACDPVKVVGPEQKRAHLYSFWRDVVRRPMLLVGTSLGGATAMDFAMTYPETVSKLVLISPQIFVDGIGPMAFMPRWLALMGVDLLRTVPLRSSANQMAYYDKKRFATDDAVVCGRLHTFMPGWRNAIASFMKSGGYTVGKKLEKKKAFLGSKEILVLWGEQDEILDPKEGATCAAKLPNCRLVWIPECGHCGHLEQPEFVAKNILELARKVGKAVQQPKAVGELAVALE